MHFCILTTKKTVNQLPHNCFSLFTWQCKRNKRGLKKNCYYVLEICNLNVMFGCKRSHKWRVCYTCRGDGLIPMADMTRYVWGDTYIADMILTTWPITAYSVDFDTKNLRRYWCRDFKPWYKNAELYTLSVHMRLDVLGEYLSKLILFNLIGHVMVFQN